MDTVNYFFESVATFLFFIFLNEGLRELFFIGFLVIYLFLAVLGLCCCADFSLVAVCGLFVVVYLFVAEPQLWGARAQHAVQRFRCPTACGMFLGQELNQCALYWQVDS